MRAKHRSDFCPGDKTASHLDEGYGDAGEESGDEQEQFSAVDVAERPNERRREKAEEAFDSHDDPVEEESVVSKLGVENLDHRGRDHSPGEELQVQQFKRRRYTQTKSMGLSG